MPARHLPAKQRSDTILQAMCDEALMHYGVRIRDNVDLDRLVDLRDRAGVIARAMMERGDARAFALARRILAHMEPD